MNFFTVVKTLNMPKIESKFQNLLSGSEIEIGRYTYQIDRETEDVYRLSARAEGSLYYNSFVPKIRLLFLEEETGTKVEVYLTPQTVVLVVFGILCLTWLLIFLSYIFLAIKMEIFDLLTFGIIFASVFGILIVLKIGFAISYKLLIKQIRRLFDQT